MPAKLRRYFAGFFASGSNSPERQRRKKLAYKNSLKKSKSKEEAMARNLFSRDLRRLQKHEEGKLTAKKTLLALKKSAKKHGFNEAYQRRLIAKRIKGGLEHDRAGIWGLSFNAGLKEINSYYYPINLVKEIEQQLETKRIQRGRFLEIGAGSGKTASEIEEFFGPRLEVIATGLTPTKEWKRFENTKNIKWKIANAENMRRLAPQGSIDIIHSNLGIQHAHRLEIALQEANRLLKKGGIIIFSIDGTSLTDKIPMPKNFELVKKTNKIIQFDEAESELFVYILRKK